MWCSPRVDGTTIIRAKPRAFVSAFVQRIETGLLRGASSRRCRYVVTRHGDDGLAFHATNWLTAFNVGLNDVELAVASDGRVSYTIQYRRWAAYALSLSAGLGLALGASFLVIDIRAYVERNAASRIPGLSTGQNVAVAWAMALFWGFVWPWILIAFHRRPVGRLMERLIAEVDAAAISGR